MILKVLYIDDDEPLRFIVEMFLRRLLEGIIVDVASSGEEALEKIKEQTYDVIISDYDMSPGMNGLQLLNIFREDYPEHCRTPFGLLTSQDGSGFKEDAEGRGVAFIHSKCSDKDIGFNYLVLLCKICRAIEAKRRQDGTAIYELTLEAMTDEVKNSINETIGQIVDYLKLDGLLVRLLLAGGDLVMTSPEFNLTDEQIKDAIAGNIEAVIASPVEYRDILLGMIFAFRAGSFTGNEQVDLKTLAGLLAAKIVVSINQKSIE